MTSTFTVSLAACVALLVTPALPPAASGQTTGKGNPPLIIASVYGRDLFEFYCATCHGRDGKGGGPAASALKVPPSDLTTIAKRNGGTFPKAQVTSVITGEPEHPVAAHGSRDMPVWGPIFRGLDPDDTMNTVRVNNIVGFIESLQAK